MAGINAALYARHRKDLDSEMWDQGNPGPPTFTLDRTEAYTGILIDDLISKGTNEPYRMFTSRAEFRLHLRIDNADKRLTPHGRRLGLIDDEAWADYEAKQTRAQVLLQMLRSTRVDIKALPAELQTDLTGPSVEGITFAQLLKRPAITIEALWPTLVPLIADKPELAPWTASLAEDGRLHVWVRNEIKTVETEIKYEGYLNQQRKSMEKLRQSEQKVIPEWFDYTAVSGLSREMKEKLGRIRPQTLGQASRISGVTPAAISLIHIYIEIQARNKVVA
jgi:tRNA uridine 5-carboxymethylaminomethyl modification enzyme